VFLAFIPWQSDLHGQAKTRTYLWQTWDALSWGTDPGGNTIKLQGLDATGAAGTLADLYKGSDGVSNNGDLIELGYFGDKSTYAPNTDTSNPFKGDWIPLTSTMTIGQKVQDFAALSESGEFFGQTVFSRNTADDVKAKHGDLDTPAPGSFTDTISYLDGAGGAVEQLDDASSQPLIGIRFYDTTPTPNTGGTSKASDGTTRYNTIMSATWAWVDTTDGFSNITKFGFHDSTGAKWSDTTALQFEFDNTDADASTLIGTGDSAVVGNDFVATVAFHDGVDDVIDVSDSGIGSAILSGLQGGGRIDGDNANVVTLHSAAGNTGADAYSFTGQISKNAGGDTGDITIVKSGTGDQELTGELDIADSSAGAAATSGYVKINQGTLVLKPVGGGPTQSMEYLTGAGNLKLDNSADADHVVDLGFTNTAAAQTLSGTLTLSASGTTNTIKVGDASGEGHQKFTGKVSGASGASAANLKKTGGGTLTLNSSSSDFDGGVTITHSGGGGKEGGIVVAGHANGLGSGTVAIEHGKLAVAGGITIANTVMGGSVDTSKKSVVGGGTGNSVATKGTINTGGTYLDIGSGGNEINVVSPGIALASSMTNGTNDHQSVAGNLNDAGTAATTQSIGTVKINDVGLMSGGVFDWEIADFDGNNADGSDWDVLQFDNLNLLDDPSSTTFDINIYGITPAGAAGAPDFSTSSASDKNLWAQGGSSFVFLSGTTVNWHGGSEWTSTQLNDYFVINDDAFAYHNNMWGGEWTVSHSSGNFSLNFSAVPEPSTYFMITGLLLLPGFRFLKRLRGGKDKGEE